MKKNKLFLLLLLLKQINITAHIFKYSSSNLNDELVEIEEFDMVGPHPRAISIVLETLKKDGLFPKVNSLLLHGPSGTGKTKYAQEIAKALDCNFIKVSGSDLINKFVGQGAANIRELFEQAQRSEISFNFDCRRKTILFIDEIDAFANKEEKNSSEHIQTSIALWTELDKIKGNNHIFVIMATNNKGRLPDPILNRVGGNQIEVGLPNKEKRIKLFEFYLKDFPEMACHFDNFAKVSKNLSNREIESACDNAIIYSKVSGEELSKSIIIQHLEKSSNPDNYNFLGKWLTILNKKSEDANDPINMLQGPSIYVGKIIGAAYFAYKAFHISNECMTLIKKSLEQAPKVVANNATA